MAFSGSVTCESYKAQLLTASHNFSISGGHTFKMALYSSGATLNGLTTAYTPSFEVTGTGYIAGGNVLSIYAQPAHSSGVGYVGFQTVTFSSVSITPRGALIYNASTANAAVAVLDFGSDQPVSASNLSVVFPPNDPVNAIIRIV